MNPGAFELLDTLGLKRPTTFSLAEALAGAPETLRYLRYAALKSSQNRVVSVAELSADRDQFARELSSGSLSAIEPHYAMLGGGAVLSCADHAYVEFVVGHPIALLRRGQCAYRVFLDAAGTSKCRTAFQGWAATQGSGTGYEWRLAEPMAGLGYRSVCLDVANAVLALDRAVLLEWFLTDVSVFFCDARDRDLEHVRDAAKEQLSSSARPMHLGDLVGTSASRVHVDTFDIDREPRPNPGDALVAANGALLSHYVTRYLSPDIAFMFLGVNDD